MFKTILIATLALFSIAGQATTNNISHKNSAGELELTGTSGIRKPALLLSTNIGGEVNGMIASINIRQKFQNQESVWVNGRYVFPLPESAAVDSLRIKIGERIIDAVIKEKEQAKKIFNQAKRDGKKAGLLQQHRPNLFSISVANIGPNETVTADMTFIDQVQFSNDTFSIALPTTLTPRYVPNANNKTVEEIKQELNSELMEQENVQFNSTGWANNNARVADAADITPPQTHLLGGQATHRFSLALLLNTGLDLQSVVSPSHPITTDFPDGKKAFIGLVNGSEPMNSDLVLSWRAVVGAVPKAALFQQEFNNSYYSMLMLTPPQINATVSLPRDITFVIDSSGSMAGGSMAQAKQALSDGLSYLTANDRFNVIDFDSSFTPLFERSQTVTAKRVESANAMIASLKADGGTEMLGALRYAMHSQTTDSYLKQIVFVTDGAIGNESELFKLINEKLGETRLFTVGIGSAPNSYFMNKAAKFGRGSYTVIRDLDQVNTKIAALFEKITRPVMRNIEVIWPNGIGQSIEQYPARIPDLYIGEPLTLLIKSDRPIDKVTATGEMFSSPWQQSLSMANKSNQTTNAENLDTVWARRKVESLMDKLVTGEMPREQVKPEVIKLGIAHNIVTKFTSLIAVEKAPSKPVSEQAKHKNVPNLMPKGNTMPAPQTATPATLLSLLGLILILLAMVLRFNTRHSQQRTFGFSLSVPHLVGAK